MLGFPQILSLKLLAFFNLIAMLLLLSDSQCEDREYSSRWICSFAQNDCDMPFCNFWLDPDFCLRLRVDINMAQSKAICTNY